jgi:hypothetical protein
LTLTVAALCLARPLFRFAGRGLGAWLTGLSIGWALLASLWLPWIDLAKSYRSVYDSIQAGLPSHYRCVAETGMGESELSMLNYFLGITAVRAGPDGATACDVLIVNGTVNTRPPQTDSVQWLQSWQGARPGDRSESFWLYIRNPAPMSASSSETLSFH